MAPMEEARGIVAELGGAELTVLLNPAAGSAEGENTAKEIETAFSQMGVSARIEMVEPASFLERLRQLVADGARAVAVGGGDGSLSSAANALAGTSTVLVPLPLGTLNHFAQRHGMATIEAATLALRDGVIARVSIGEVNGRYFINNASCGFYPRLVRHREAMSSLLSKWPAAFVATILVMMRRRLIDLELELEGKRIQRKTAAMWIGLGRNSLKLPIPGDSATEGEVLEIVLPKAHGRIELTALAWRLWWRLKKHEKPVDPRLETLRAAEFTLRGRWPIDVATDGEVQTLAVPLNFRFHPGALRVLCLIAPERA
jgi:diacylglycerol kinase family enzyme